MKKTRACACVVLLFALPRPTYAQRFGWCDHAVGASIVSFDGTLSRGETFERTLSGNLVFELKPFDNGWAVAVTEKGRVENFAGVVDLPLRFHYTLEIMGWHFGHSPTAPGNERSFEFVLSMEDYTRVDRERTVLLWPYTFSQADVEKAQAFSVHVPCGAGKLIIGDPMVRNADNPAAAEIERFTFHADIAIPK